MTEGDWTPPPKTYWPTADEVAQIVSAILKHISESPDWAPKLRDTKVETPDETWKGWGRK